MASCGSRILAVLVSAVALVSVAAPAAFSAPSEANWSAAALESGVFRQLNAIRADHGLVPLRVNTRLAAAAEQHSREMADDGYFDHNSVDGTSFSARLARWYPVAGFRSWSVAENMLWWSPSVEPSGAVAKWMRSPMHRANILNPDWRDIGVGVVHTASAGGTYGGRPVTIITTDFGVRR
jgi:uncharacterized protein YkwD